jgi:ABC-type amino acid transport system permease subunit
VVTELYLDSIKAVPLLLGVFWFYHFLPIFLGYDVSILMSGTVALVVLSSVHMSEGFRSGWRVVGSEQVWAARLAGLSRAQTMWTIVTPQASITMLPALLTQTISLFKDSAVVFVIGVMELTQTGMAMANRFPEKLLFIYIAVGAFYFVVCSLMSFAFSRIEEKLAVRKAILNS